MKNKLFAVAAVLGLFAGGVVLGQALENDEGDLFNSKAGGAVQQADRIYTAYTRASVFDAKSAPQITQVATEASVRLQYLQIKQNAEIIRLLTELNKKK